MNTPYRVLVPLDGSDESEAILPTILPLARQGSVHLTLFSVLPPESFANAADDHFSRARAFLFRHGIEAETRVDWGDPAATIAFNASEAERNLIAMSTHGRTGLRRALLGSVAAEVVRQAKVPVLAARPGSRMDGWKQVVVGLDGSPRAMEVLEPAVRVASVLGARVHLLGVEEEGLFVARDHHGDSSGESTAHYLRKVAARLEANGVRADVFVREGRAAREIVRYADEIRAGVIALATHGRTGMRGLLMGSVAGEVVGSSTCPVLLQRSVSLQVSVPPEGVAP